MASGAACACVPIAVELLDAGARRGFGRRQAALLTVGIALFLSGLLLMLIAARLRRTTPLPDVPRLRDTLLIAIVLGGLTGVAYATAIYGSSHPRAVSRDVVWMSPLANVILYLMIGLVLHPLTSLLPSRARLAAILVAFLSLSLCMSIKRLGIAEWAALLLAAGLAWHISRVLARHTALLAALARYLGAWTIVAVLLATAIVRGRMWRAENRAYASLDPAPAGAPNVLLIVADTLRASSMSVYGYDRPTTPNLQRLAQRAVVFDHAIATAPWTLTSHVSMMTAEYPGQTSADWITALDGRSMTIAEALAARGYRTGGFVANLAYCSHAHGLHRGFARYDDFQVSAGQVLLGSEIATRVANNSTLRSITGRYDVLNRKPAALINDQFLHWLSTSPDGPFFAFLNYFDAHEPYVPPAPFDTMFSPRRPRGPFKYDHNDGERVNKFDMSPEQVQAEINAYDGAIASIDAEVVRLFDRLESAGVLDNTIVIFTSDHGEQFGEHRLFGHGNSLYNELLHVPLIVWLPKQREAGRRVTEFVTLRDIPATIAGLTGAAPAFPGRSLASTWGVTDPHTESPILSEVNGGFGNGHWYPTAQGDLRSIIIDPHHYIRQEDDVEEIYDLREDPRQLVNLLETPEGQRVAEQLRPRLRDALGTSKPDAHTAAAEVTDDAPANHDHAAARVAHRHY